MAPFFATGDRTTCRSLVRRSGSPRSSWRDVFRTIRALGERGITILLVEQNVAMSLKVSQRAYVLETGRIVLLIGPILEERHGSVPLLLVILLTALVTGLANLALSQHALVGASGVAFMMILLASMANMRGGEIRSPSRRSCTRSAPMASPHLAHLVGGAAGAAFGFLALLSMPRPSEPPTTSHGSNST